MKKIPPYIMSDSYWLSEFRERMSNFAASTRDGLQPVSVKIRVSGGCFHRSCSPEAYREIDDYIRQHQEALDFRFEEHESGPEILVWAAGALSLSTAVINLVVAILKARSEGIKKGDRPREELEVIIRGFDPEDDRYVEEKILRVSSSEKVDAAKLIAALKKPVNLPKVSKVAKKRSTKKKEG